MDDTLKQLLAVAADRAEEVGHWLAPILHRIAAEPAPHIIGSYQESRQSLVLDAVRKRLPLGVGILTGQSVAAFCTPIGGDAVQETIYIASPRWMSHV